MNEIHIKEILIHPRQRKTFDAEKVNELAGSLQRVGLIHPVVLERVDNSLIAGHRRLLAAAKLGWDKIAFTYKDELSPLDRKRMELEENLHRVNLEWWEEAAAIADIDALQKEIDPEWNLRKTAEMVGKSVGTVSQSTQLAKEMKKDPSIRKEKTLRGALTKLDTKKQLEQRAKAIEKKSAGRIKTFPAEIIVGDSRTLIRLEPDEEFDAIVSNFPFGVDYEQKGQVEKLYEDEESQNIDLIRDIVQESYRVLKPDSWFVAFYDIRKITYSNPARQYVEKVRDALFRRASSFDEYNELLELSYEALGLAYWFEMAGYSYVRTVPCIWAKPNKRQGIIGDPRKGLITAYEAFIFAAKGNAVLLKQGRNNLFVYDTLNPGERDFEMQMPVSLCKEIVSMVSLGGGRILDPFAGVGSFGEGALENGCSFRGYELNEKRAKTGNLRLREHILAKAG